MRSAEDRPLSRICQYLSINPLLVSFPRINLVISSCKADYASILQSTIDEPFRPVCWSNPNVLVDEWEKWISGLVQKFVPRGTKRCANLPPWVNPGTTHFIKKRATKREFLPEGNGNLLQLVAQVDIALQLDRSDYENQLSNTRSQNLFRHFKNSGFNQFFSTMYHGVKGL